MKTHPSLAVILAAGRGTRMGKAGKVKPKGFITLGERPIVEESILKLRRNSITKIIIVTGHGREYYERLAQRYPGLIKLVHNKYFADSGSMYSLYIAKDLVGERPFLLVESDLIYEERAISETLKQPHHSVLLLSGPTEAGDEVYVTARRGFLTGLSKRREELAGIPVGELVGITKLSFKVFEKMIKAARQVFASSRHMEYENAIVAVSALSPIYCHVLHDLVWGEIDNREHLARARNEIFSRILRIDSIEKNKNVNHGWHG